MELRSPPCCRLDACVCVVREYISVWTEPHGGFQWRGCRVDSTVRGDDSDSYEQCFSAPNPNPNPLFSGRPIARRVPGPSQPSFPHGKYLTLTVAHVCHITRRFRRGKKKTLYVWWMMELCNRSLMKRCFILLWCINCLEHIHLHTLAITLLLTPALPQVLTHIHTLPPPPHPKPGMCKHGPHLASTTFLCYSPKKGNAKMGVYVYILCS